MKSLSRTNKVRNADGGLIVLVYHRIQSSLPKGDFVIPPADFKAQMNFLHMYKNQFEVVSIENALRRLSPAEKSKENKLKTKILITFDDGYQDNYLNAFPVLKKYRFPAVIFLTTDYISTEIKKERYKNTPWERDYLSFEEIEEMMRTGISFGAHTATHPHLKKLSLQKIRNEFLKSYFVLKSITNRSDIAFCYPYGEYDTRIKGIAKETGFSCAFTIKPGINYKKQDLFKLKRIEIKGQDNLEKFRKKIE